MGINIYTLSDEKCLEVKPLPGDAVQTKVSCQGDIAVVPFYPDKNTHGTAWLLLQERNTGEIGRDVPGNDPLDLRHAEGVLIGATDPRSLSVIIEALTRLRDRLGFAEAMAIKAREDIEDECARGMAKQTAGDVDRALLAEASRPPLDFTPLGDPEAEQRLADDMAALEEAHRPRGLPAELVDPYAVRPGVDLPEVDHTVGEGITSLRDESVKEAVRTGRGIPFGHHIDPKTGRMVLVDRAGNVMDDHPLAKRAEEVWKAMKENGHDPKV